MNSIDSYPEREGEAYSNLIKLVTNTGYEIEMGKKELETYVNNESHDVYLFVTNFEKLNKLIGITPAGITMPLFPIKQDVTLDLDSYQGMAVFAAKEELIDLVGDNFSVINPEKKSHFIGVYDEVLLDKETTYPKVMSEKVFKVSEFVLAPQYKTNGLEAVIHEFAAHVTATIQGVSYKMQHIVWYGNDDGSSSDAGQETPDTQLKREVIKLNQ